MAKSAAEISTDAAKDLQVRRREAAIRKIQELMKEYKLKVGDLNPNSQRTKKLRLGAEEVTARAFYRNPSTGQIWDGSGNPPRWLLDFEAAKQPRAKFRIKQGWGRLPGQGKKKATKTAAKKTVRKSAK